MKTRECGVSRGSGPDVVVARDARGRIVERRVLGLGDVDVRRFAYDPGGRLALVHVPDGLAERYEYDRQGRRRFEVNALRAIEPRAFVYYWDNRLVSAGNVRYEHDEETGFRRSKAGPGGRVMRYTYAPDGLLLRVDLPEGTVIEYAYDAEHRRTVKAVDGRVAECYGWDGPRMAAFRDASGETIFRYPRNGHAPGALERGGRRYDLVLDQVGTPLAVRDEHGRAVKRLDFDSFGNPILDTNPALRLPFGFACGLHDPDTGLVRFGVRDYDPDVGRFTAPDPLGPAGGEDDPYGYCLDDPVNLVDPSGMETEASDSGMRIAKSAGLGALLGILRGIPGGWPGMVVGGMAGGTSGLLKGTVFESIKNWPREATPEEDSEKEDKDQQQSD